MTVAARIGDSDWELTGIGHTGGVCQHCDRELKHVYSVRNTTTGEAKTVGRTCCKKVTGWTLALADARRLLWYAQKQIERAANWEHFTAAFPEVAAHITANQKTGGLWKGQIVDAPERVRANFAADYRRRIMQRP